MQASKLNLTRIAFAAALAFGMSAAMAENNPPKTQPPAQPQAVAGAVAGAVGIGGAGGQGGAGGAATALGVQGQKQQQVIENSGNGTGVAIVNVTPGAAPTPAPEIPAHTTHKATVKNTGDVMLGAPASGPCNGLSGGFGASVPGVTLGANVSTVDYGCEQRETVRVSAAVGRMDIANLVLEDMTVVQNAIANAEKRKQKQAQAAANAASGLASNEWVDQTGKVVYVGTDETIIKRMGLSKALPTQAVAAK